jgi:protein-disulfide isomerase
MEEKENKTKTKKAKKLDLNYIVIGLLVLNIILVLSIIMPMSFYQEDNNLEKKVSNIETKVNAIDNFFRTNVRGYDSEGNSNLDNSDSSNNGQDSKVEVSADDDPWLGSENAKVTVIEFSDYQCPFCRKYWTESYSQLKSDYIDTNKIKYVFRDFPLNFHPGAKLAAIAANCIGEQKGNEGYFEFHDIVFSEQNKKGSGTIQFGEEDVMSWVDKIEGINKEEFNECYNDPNQKSEVEADFAAGAKAGVSGTPSFFINGKLLVGAQPYSVIKAEIEKALNE